VVATLNIAFQVGPARENRNVRSNIPFSNERFRSTGTRCSTETRVRGRADAALACTDCRLHLACSSRSWRGCPAATN
jgi:hypothetical protein